MVLTSAKCAAILEEREQKEVEENSKQKADREQKKKEKEEAAMKKAEERARKAEEAVKKRENKTKKRTMQVPDTGTQAKKQKTTSESVAATGTWTTTDPSSSIDPGASTSSRYSSCLSAAAATPSGTSENDLNANVNSDVCCVCYRTFEDDQQQGNGLEWVHSVCGRWLHEECICEIDIDEQGRALFCPFCAV